jgi:DMSO/TMAO reductase YedYZ molybdopterin-dependent catalytic subunit
VNKRRHPELLLPESEIRAKLRRGTRRDFLILGTAGLAMLGGYEWLRHSKDADGTPYAERRTLEWNRVLSEAYLSDNHLMPTFPAGRIEYLKPNGGIGLEDALDVNSWKLNVVTGAGQPPLSLDLADVMALPKVEMITRFCCIEGWSVVTSWAGARFSEFTKRFFPPGHSLPDYVSLSTPDESYYVGLDMKSALHPQTLLAYEQNGLPLRPEHGAPLRLVIPVKYGIKNLKRIGAIEYINKRPADYWAEEGYDWFAGL